MENYLGDVSPGFRGSYAPISAPTSYVLPSWSNSPQKRIYLKKEDLDMARQEEESIKFFKDQVDRTPYKQHKYFPRKEQDRIISFIPPTINDVRVLTYDPIPVVKNYNMVKSTRADHSKPGLINRENIKDVRGETRMQQPFNKQTGIKVDELKTQGLHNITVSPGWDNKVFSNYAQIPDNRRLEMNDNVLLGNKMVYTRTTDFVPNNVYKSQQPLNIADSKRTGNVPLDFAKPAVRLGYSFGRIDPTNYIIQR